MNWFNKEGKYFLSASLICGDPLRIKEELDELRKAQVDSLHFDVMDGHFVPRVGLYPEMLKAIKRQTDIPIDVHLMLDHPMSYVEKFIEAGADLISFHIESDDDIAETIKFIKSQNVKVGLVLKPDTSLETLNPFLKEIDLVMLMAIQPGILGQKVIPETFERISELAHKVKDYPIIIEIDGGVTLETAPKMIEHGAHLLVCGTGTIYRPHEDTLENKVVEVRNILDQSIS
jgi:ribulose-phosphate 3-epimerase